MSPFYTVTAAGLQVLNVSERSLDDHPAIAIILSDKLSSRRRYDRYLTVKRKDGSLVRGAWVLGKDRRTLYFSNIEPQKKYTVLVKRGLRARNGARLPANREFSVKTRRIAPAFGFASKGSVLIARLSAGLPIVTVNVPEVDVEFFRIRDRFIMYFLGRFGYPGTYSYYSLNRLNKMADSVYMNRFRTLGKKNTRTVTHIPVHQIKELRRPGLYVATLRRAGFFSYSTRMTFYYVSNIGLHTRAYSNGLSVYASSLASGRPLPDVAVTLFNSKGRLLGKVYTNAKGEAKIKGDLAKKSLLIARRGRDISVLSYRKPALDLSEFDVSGALQHPVEAYAWSSRDLIRPGEDLDVSVLLRDHDGRAVKPIPLSLRLRRPDGREVARFTWQSRDLGYYFGKLRIPVNAQTGRWSLEIRTSPAAKKPIQVHQFRVEEFLPERLKLVLETAIDRLVAGQDWLIDIASDYLYGAPAANNRVKAVLNIRANHNPLADTYKGFFFGDIKESSERTRVKLLDARLDSKGRFKLSVRSLKKRYQSPMTLRVTTSVFETGGRPVTRSISRVLWPATALVGVRPLYKGKYAEQSSNAGFELIRVGADGKTRAGALEVVLVREDRHYYWTHTRQGGWHYAHSESQYPVWRQNVDIKAGARTRISLPVQYGSYRLEVRDPETRLTTRYRFYAGWNWRSRMQSGTARPDKVSITLNKPVYRAGDTIVAKILPPHAGRAILFIESDRQLWHRRIRLPAKGRTVRIRLPRAWANRHDLYLSAVVLRPANARRKITPNRAVGLAHIKLDRSDRKLSVSISAPKKMRPERDLKVTVKLKDLKGQKAMVTVAAVDVGILNITGFKTPDPLALFFAKRRYGVGQYDLYGRVIELMKGVRARLRYGGDMARAVASQRSKRAHARVKTVALFSGPVKVDANGEAHVKLRVPDHNGTLRLMAVAFTEDRFGSAEDKLVVAAPVIAEIAMPRFMSARDKSTLTLDLHNLSGSGQKLQVGIKVSDPLQIRDSQRSITLDNKGRMSLQFPLLAGNAFGVGKITLTVKGDDINIRRQYELGVRPAWPGVRRVSHKTLQDGDSLELDDDLMRGLMKNTVSVSLLASPVPPLNVGSAVKGLLAYPYGCLEQTTSRAFPLLYIDSARARRVGLKPFTLARRSELVAKAIGRLRSMQLSSGGFSLWGSRGPEELWLSPYVADFLLEARRQGFSVPDDMLKRSLRNLRYRLIRPDNYNLRQAYTRSRKHLLLASRAYAAYVLARVKRAPLGNLRVLFDNHGKDARSGLPLVHLGLALLMQGDKDRGMKAIRAGLAKDRERHAYLGDYGSRIRDTGLIIALLARHRVEVEGADKLIYRLSKELREKRYLSTQERLAIFQAAFAGERHGNAWTGTLGIGDVVRKISLSGSLLRYLAAADLDAGVSLTVASPRPVYTAVEVTGYSLERPKAKSDELQVSRRLYDMKGKPVGDRPLRVGELLLVHVQVNSKRRLDNVLVVDLLPAGLEIENQNLSKGEGLGNVRIVGVKPGAAMSLSSIRHREYRDDRFVAAIKVFPGRAANLFYLARVVTPGEYIVPPPFAEDMYVPEWHGIGIAPLRLKVVKP